MNWKMKPGVWTCEPFTVRMQIEERSNTPYYELFDHTRLVDVFMSDAEAKDFARLMNAVTKVQA